MAIAIIDFMKHTGPHIVVNLINIWAGILCFLDFTEREQ